jgi:phosphonatase-like hydrolase
MTIEMVAFDVAGTVVNDDGVVIAAFEEAFQKSEPELWPTHGAHWTQYAIETMGQSKIEVFTHLLKDKDKAERANQAFEESYLHAMARDGAEPIAGAEEIFRHLRTEDIPVVLTTGFSRATLDSLISQLGWEGLITFSVTPSEVERGRPYPDMLQRAAQQLGVANPLETIVIGDTSSDMQSGVAFGAGQIVGVLTGAHDEFTLRIAGATTIVNSVADLRTLV